MNNLLFYENIKDSSLTSSKPKIKKGRTLDIIDSNVKVIFSPELEKAKIIEILGSVINFIKDDDYFDKEHLELIEKIKRENASIEQSFKEMESW